jgi:hypothetical protein
MKLAFYYNISVSTKEGDMFLPEYLERFIEGLNRHVNKLYLIAHTRHGEDELKLPSNITLIDLGKKPNSSVRSFFLQKEFLSLNW